MSREKAKRSAAMAAESHLQELRVDTLRRPRRHSDNPVLHEKERLPKMSSRSTDYVYVNQAYVGSTNIVVDPRAQQSPVTSVIREQYWACSKWPLAQRILAISVGILVGAVVGLVVTMIIRGKDADEVLGTLFPDLSRVQHGTSHVE